MNRDLALQMRTDLRIIIEGYERFLFNEITSGEQKVRAVEALATRDVVRSVGMSEVSRNRADTVLGRSPRAGKSAQAFDIVSNTASGPAIETRQDGLFEEVGIIGSVTQPAVVREPDKSNDNLFKNLKDCIPCNQDWSLGDFDWGRLKALLTFDIERRFAWLLDVERLLDDDGMLNRLCALLHSFKDLCPQDLLVLIAMLAAFLAKTLDSIKFNFDGVLKDILGMILRPYIGGLDDFLNMYIQFIVDQIDCILNLVQVSSEQLRDLEIDIDIGRKSKLTAQEIESGNTSAFKFRQDIITGAGDKFFDDVASGTKRTREFLRHDTKKFTHALANDIPAYITGLAKDVVDWIESASQIAQDAVIDILGGEWLVTGQNMSFLQQMQSVATLMSILQVIYNLGDLDELCNEDNIVRVIEQVNERVPGQVVITDRDLNTPSNLISGRPDNLQPLPSGGRMEGSGAGSGGTEGAGSGSINRIPFSLSGCLKRRGDVSEAQLRQWMEELS